ncbi:MAG: hypothetical protein LBR66_00060 [Candidatus Symbiothrix sp.]|jgi:hypothetical protein|nr:hypothetical protein [Candidatus Symbiothrix sp.]
MNEKMNDIDNFSRIIGQKLQDYAYQPDEGAWDKLDRQLTGKSAKFIRKLWISGLSTAASIAALWFILPITQQQNKNDHGTTSSNSDLVGNLEGLTTDVPSNELLSFSGISNQPLQTLSGRQKYLSTGETVGRRDSVPVSGDNLNLQSQEVVKEEVKQKEEQKNTVRFVFREKDIFADQQPVIKRRKNSLGLHVSSGGGLLAESNFFGKSNLRSATFITDAPSFLKGELMKPDDFLDIRNNIPLSFGFTFRKEFDIISVESGVIYTYLYSKYEKPKNQLINAEASLSMHYIGVPLKLIKNIYGNKYDKWIFYIAAGGMIEKGLLSDYKQTEYSDNSKKGEIKISRERISGVQLSLQASLGADYKIYKDCSLYFEPQIQYYLQNNQPYNIRTSYPFVFGLNLGIRYSW